MQQTEIKIVVYDPTSDQANFTADVYVDGKRVHCGKGGLTYNGALIEATNWIKATMIHQTSDLQQMRENLQQLKG